MTPATRNNVGRIWALAALAVGVAACGGATPTATVAPAAPTVAATAAPATAVASTAAPITPAPPTTVPATATSSGPALVDLAFTGTRVFTASGTNGTCKLVTVDGVTKFGFEASKDDYPALGESFSVTELDTVSIKWTLDANLAYANDPDVVIEISADHHTVTLDQDLEPLSSGGTVPGPQHVKGTITCS